MPPPSHSKHPPSRGLSEEQLTSYEAQVDYYTRFIQENPDWDFVEVYTDEGISAVNTKRRDGFNRMILYAQGLYQLPGLLLGYQRCQDGEIQVDEAGARVVRSIDLLALAGKSSTDICRILMIYDILSPGQRQRWELNTSRSILKKLRTTDLMRENDRRPLKQLAA